MCLIRWLYLAYAYRGNGQRVRVVRVREQDGALTDRRVVIEAIPAAQYHAGTRADFGPDGKLYVTTGDASRRQLAQQLNSLAGKTLRLNDDGQVPPDNPFVGRRRGLRNDGKPKVISWPDTFNNFFHPEVAQAAVEVLENARRAGHAAARLS